MPLCKVHNVDMKPSKFGGFYCTQQNADGSYCKEKFGQPPKVRSPQANGHPENGKAQIAAAALHFAAALCRGQGHESVNDALEVAKKAYDLFSEV